MPRTRNKGKEPAVSLFMEKRQIETKDSRAHAETLAFVAEKLLAKKASSLDSHTEKKD
jgi:hypothetical protein